MREDWTLTNKKMTFLDGAGKSGHGARSDCNKLELHEKDQQRVSSNTSKVSSDISLTLAWQDSRSDLMTKQKL